jgi:hypothetical protein
MEEEVYGLNLRPQGLAPLQGAQITAPSSSQITSGLLSSLGSVGGAAAAANPLTAGLAAFSGLVGLFKTIDANKDAKRRAREAAEAQKKAEERFDNYASNFNIPSQMGGTQAEIRARLQANPNTVFDPSMQMGSFSTPGNFAGGLQYTPGFDQDSFKVQYDPTTGGFITTTTTPQGKTTATKHRGVSLKDLQDFNLNAGEIDKKLNMLNMMDGVLDVPWWESQPGFEEIAGEYQSTNPNSKYYDPNAEYTGPKPPSEAEAAKIVIDEDGTERLEFPDEVKRKIAEGVDSIKQFLPTEAEMEQILNDMPKKEDGSLDLEAINSQYYDNIQSSGNSVTGQIVNNLPTPMGTSIKQLAGVPLGAQLYEGSNIQNPYGRFRDVSGVIQDRSDLVMGPNDRRNLLVDRSDMISDVSDRFRDTRSVAQDLSQQENLTGVVRDLRFGAQDFSGLATDTSTLASNTFANLQVATQAADLKAQQTDQALANTLSTIRATGAGAGGATAIAQAALQSKLGIAATIEQQEARNNELRARGEQAVEQIRMSESKRIQDIKLAERLRLESLRQTEGRRIDDVALAEGRALRELGISEGRRLQDLSIADRIRESQLGVDEARRVQEGRFGEARRMDDARFNEAGRIQQIQLQEALRKQAAAFSEQQALREADVAGITYQQAIAEDRSQRNLDRLAGLQTQAMVNEQAARASRQASSGALAGGLLQLAGTLGAAAINPGG